MELNVLTKIVKKHAKISRIEAVCTQWGKKNGQMDLIVQKGLGNKHAPSLHLYSSVGWSYRRISYGFFRLLGQLQTQNLKPERKNWTYIFRLVQLCRRRPTSRKCTLTQNKRIENIRGHETNVQKQQRERSSVQSWLPSPRWEEKVYRY